MCDNPPSLASHAKNKRMRTAQNIERTLREVSYQRSVSVGVLCVAGDQRATATRLAVVSHGIVRIIKRARRGQTGAMANQFPSQRLIHATSKIETMGQSV